MHNDLCETWPARGPLAATNRADIYNKIKYPRHKTQNNTYLLVHTSRHFENMSHFSILGPQNKVFRTGFAWRANDSDTA
jgi:hypothetical protein